MKSWVNSIQYKTTPNEVEGLNGNLIVLTPKGVRYQ